ncbi:hypothetical protein [Pseudomonas sp. AOB-7]|uniref:hypothetical protein n=1 Tax=Pseudomonas sp. AOB-7 TaxID=2482750 RepID=UPI0011C3EB20|nr:hypothetical protein [Pseudomonas sp. AOB-7]
MHKDGASVMVYCRNAGSLIGYAARLNVLGHFRLSLCGSAAEVVELLEAGRKFRFLIYDDFGLDTHALTLSEFAWFEAFEGVVVIADVNSEQRSEIYRWAKGEGLPLRAILQAPLRDYELAQVVGFGDVWGGELSDTLDCLVSRSCALRDGECPSVCAERLAG